MNISNVMPNVNGRSINRATAAVLRHAVSGLPENIIGKFGSIRDDLVHSAAKISRCGTSAVIGRRKDSSGKIEEKILEMHRCGKTKICCTCADVNSGRRLRKIDESISSNWKSARYAYFVTFTVPDGPDLAERQALLRGGIRKFYLMGRKRGMRRSYGESSKIRGAHISYEVTIGENSKMWHPHAHAIFFTDKPLDFAVYDSEIKCIVSSEQRKKNKPVSWFKREMIRRRGLLYPYVTWSGVSAMSKISREWKLSTGGEGKNLHVYPIWTDENRPKMLTMKSLFERIEKKTADEIDSDGALTLLKKIKYSLKYSVKPGDLDNMTPEQIFELMDSFRGFPRTVEYWGFLRGGDVKPWQVCGSYDVMQRDECESSVVIDDMVTRAMLSADCGGHKTRDDRMDDLRNWCSGSEIVSVDTPTKKEDIKFFERENKIKNWDVEKEQLSIVQRYRREMGDMAEEFSGSVLLNMLRGALSPPDPLPDVPHVRVTEPGAAYYYGWRDIVTDGNLSTAVMWQAGADAHMEFRREVTIESQVYRSFRRCQFARYLADEISGDEYIYQVRLAKKYLHESIGILREARDRVIDGRTNGVYSYVMISDNIKRRRKRNRINSE